MLWDKLLTENKVICHKRQWIVLTNYTERVQADPHFLCTKFGGYTRRMAWYIPQFSMTIFAQTGFQKASVFVINVIFTISS